MAIWRFRAYLSPANWTLSSWAPPCCSFLSGRTHCNKTDREIPVHTHDDAGRQRFCTGKYFRHEGGVFTSTLPGVFKIPGNFLRCTHGRTSALLEYILPQPGVFPYLRPPNPEFSGKIRVFQRGNLPSTGVFLWYFLPHTGIFRKFLSFPEISNLQNTGNFPDTNTISYLLNTGVTLPTNGNFLPLTHAYLLCSLNLL